MGSALDEQALETMIRAVDGRPLAMLNLARTMLVPTGRFERARALCEAAQRLAPDDAEVAAHANSMRGLGIGDWYFTMVQDHDRHDLYARVFRDLLPPDCTVLDIGAGTGLFAMIAARNGAARVIACERDADVARAATDIVALNGLSDRVTIVNKDALNLAVGVDLDERADVLLWDNLANNLLGANGVQTIEDAKRRLLKPGATIIPGRAEVMVALVEDLRSEDRLMGVCGEFDLSPFNRLSGSDVTIKPSRIARRSEPVSLFDIDFRQDGAIQPARVSRPVTSTGGRVSGIAQWVRFHLSDTLVYDTSGETVTAFGTQFHAVTPRDTTVDQTVTIHGSHDRLHTWFWLDNP